MELYYLEASIRDQLHDLYERLYEPDSLVLPVALRKKDNNQPHHLPQDLLGVSESLHEPDKGTPFVPCTLGAILLSLNHATHPPPYILGPNP